MSDLATIISLSIPDALASRNERQTAIRAMRISMDEDMARDLARQFREHINYTGDTEQFDQEVLGLIKEVENQCAIVVEKTPTALFLVSQPQSLLGIIAASVRGTI